MVVSREYFQAKIIWQPSRIRLTARAARRCRRRRFSTTQGKDPPFDDTSLEVVRLIGHLDSCQILNDPTIEILNDSQAIRPRDCAAPKNLVV